MRLKYTIEIGDHLNVNTGIVLTGIGVAIGSTITNPDLYTLELIHHPTSRDLLYVVLAIESPPVGGVSINTVLSAISRVPGVAVISGEGVYLEGPAKGKTRMSQNSYAAFSSQMNSLTWQVAANRDQFRRADAQIQFLPDTPSGSTPVAITVAVTNDVDVINQFSEVSGCRVNITGGTLSATAKLRQGTTLSPAGGPLNITFTNGEATLLIEDTATGTVQLSITDTTGSGLDVTDTATVTLT
jgi:hypothetical protein